MIVSVSLTCRVWKRGSVVVVVIIVIVIVVTVVPMGIVPRESF